MQWSPMHNRELAKEIDLLKQQVEYYKKQYEASAKEYGEMRQKCRELESKIPPRTMTVTLEPISGKGPSTVYARVTRCNVYYDESRLSLEHADGTWTYVTDIHSSVITQKWDQ